MGDLFKEGISINIYQKLSDNLATYYQVTGIPVTLFDHLGCTLVSYGERPEYCRIIAAETGMQSPCQQKHFQSGLVSRQLKMEYFWDCPAGLYHFSAAIVRNGKFLGSVLGGPILLEEPDEYAVKEVVNKFHIRPELRDQLYSSLFTIKQLDPRQSHYVSQLLYQMVDGLSDMGGRESELQYQQSRIGENIRDLKTAPTENDAFYELEQALIRETLAGNRRETESTLNQLVTKICFTNGYNFEITRYNLIELYGVLNRALIQSGRDPAEIYFQMYCFQTKCVELTNIEELITEFTKSIFLLVDSIRNQMGLASSPIVQRAINYILDHYTEEISLKQVADEVNVSQNYLSKIFKQEMHQTFSDYLTNLRIDVAKKCLSRRTSHL